MADNVSILKQGYDAFARGDVPFVLSLFDPQIEWNEAEHFIYWNGAPVRGGQAIVNDVFARLPKDFDGFRIEIKRIINGGDTLVVEARYKATAKATGKPFDSQTVHVWDFNSSGKILKFQQYTDTFQAAQVTGITPKA